jgi:4-carboxymuconolactone decarboxylase
MEGRRYEKGLKKMMEIDGEAGQRVVTSLAPVFPDLARLIVEYSFGDIYSREILSPREQEIAVIAALAAMGNARPQLMVHLNGGMNTGLTQQEIRELILHISVYAGFPSAINAVTAFTEVLLERGAEKAADDSIPADADSEDRFEKGRKHLEAIAPGQVSKLRESMGTFCPDLITYIVEFGYGDVYARGVLAVRERQIATIAALAALGNAAPQLEFHVLAGFNAGLTAREICEIMILMTVFAGFPAAINGVHAVKKVYGSGGAE